MFHIGRGPRPLSQVSVQLLRKPRVEGQEIAAATTGAPERLNGGKGNRERSGVREGGSSRDVGQVGEECREVKDLPTIFVVSHRRSGTHATIDWLHNLLKFGAGSRELGYNIVKTNHIVANRSLSCECLNWMRSRGKIIHVWRPFVDVLTSYFFYRRKYDRVFRASVRSVEEFSLSQEYFSSFLDTYVRSCLGLESA